MLKNWPEQSFLLQLWCRNHRSIVHGSKQHWGFLCCFVTGIRRFHPSNLVLAKSPFPIQSWHLRPQTFWEYQGHSRCFFFPFIFPHRMAPVYGHVTMMLFLLLQSRLCHDFHYKPQTHFFSFFYFFFLSFPGVYNLIIKACAGLKFSCQVLVG